MRVLVYPHDLNVGGSQTNAIEIAAKIRDLGVESIVFGREGVLNNRLRELDLEFIESPDPGRRPSLRASANLRNIARTRGLDVLHGYEWPPSLECFAASCGLVGTVAVSTIMSMASPAFIPRSMRLIVGTQQIGADERSKGRAAVDVLEPPVDLQHNLAPPRSQIIAFRKQWSIRPESRLIVCVTRLAKELKSEGLRSAIDAMTGQMTDLPVQFMIVGDGPEWESISRLAARANELRGSDTVILTGAMSDPRTAYAAADIVLGMGGSALRALAFAKPLIVQGENGFFRLLTPESLPLFEWQGWYGVGKDKSQGPTAFERELRAAWDLSTSAELGAFGKRIVRSRFSLEAAAEQQLKIYENALQNRPSTSEKFQSATRAGSEFAAYYVVKKLRKLHGHGPSDDFNARPVAKRNSRTSPEFERPGPDPRGALLYISGAPWHAVPGTDLRLATAMGRTRPVIWVDPPISIVSRIRRRIKVPHVSTVAPGVTRIHTTTLPGVTKPGVRFISQRWIEHRVKSYLHEAASPLSAILSSSPEPILKEWESLRTPRIYFATDDFVGGAELLGMSKSHAQSALESNLNAADIAIAVSPTLVRKLETKHNNVRWFPNGCDLGRYEGIDQVSPDQRVAISRPIVCLIGQINERLDLEIIEEVIARNVSLLVVGPRYEQNLEFKNRFDDILRHPNIQWIDRVPADSLPALLRTSAVGITPYERSEFNDSSFPLKTLEYLAAGIPAVVTDLPASQLLRSSVVRVADSRIEFANIVEELLHETDLDARAAMCRSESRRFSWEARASELESIITYLHANRAKFGYSRPGAT